MKSNVSKYMPVSENNPLMTLAEAAEALRVSLPTLRKLLDDASLDTVRIGRRVFVKSKSLETFILKGGR